MKSPYYFILLNLFPNKSLQVLVKPLQELYRPWFEVKSCVIRAVNWSRANRDTHQMSFPWGTSSSRQAPSGTPSTAIPALHSALPLLGIIPPRAPCGTVSTPCWTLLWVRDFFFILHVFLVSSLLHPCRAHRIKPWCWCNFENCSSYFLTNGRTGLQKYLL